MRITVDTNVLIAAFIARGVCDELLEHVVRHHELVLSPVLLDELRRVLHDKFHMSTEEVESAATLLREHAVWVDPSPLDEPVCRDPDDDHVLATAIEGASDCLVTGDDDLLVLERHADIPTLRPSDFWTFEAQR